MTNTQSTTKGIFKRLILPIATALALTASLLPTNKAEAAVTNPNADEEVVFYVPHQDDEALTMGVGILNHIRLGYDVHVVLLTNGAASGVRTRLGMTKEDFVTARDTEFLHSLRLMGVKPENTEFLNYEDGKLTAANVEAVVRKYEAKYPGARHKTYTYNDTAPDHKAAGLGLLNATKKGVTSDSRYYVRRGLTAPAGKVLMKDTFHPYYLPILQSVTQVYKVENQALGLYGIGYKSVKSSFDWLSTTPSAKYHK